MPNACLQRRTISHSSGVGVKGSPSFSAALYGRRDARRYILESTMRKNFGEFSCQAA